MRFKLICLILAIVVLSCSAYSERDSDSDQVLNINDKCPDTEIGSIVEKQQKEIDALKK